MKIHYTVFQCSLYFSIPLEQGLRRLLLSVFRLLFEYFRIPLEQGLRRTNTDFGRCFVITYFRIPLEQGLRLIIRFVARAHPGIFVFH